ncbi:hypothetical protein GCM10007071_06520 [Marinobacter zhanjiangensis]|uniref:Uncharacterized protein n=1 Tax=Marinobacter zhanjiangensis TaxID=578215 RepID=A0ABQ3AQF3_9GAMM|nr:hypothetical protein GCM10007071_06520 [Marinobacter zhanjiangensis]
MPESCTCTFRGMVSGYLRKSSKQSLGSCQAIPEKSPGAVRQRGWVGYNDPEYLKERHGIEGCDKPLENISKALENLASVATQ